MAIAISEALKRAMIERCNQHCIAWARADASLWGMSSDHHLDEPVKLSQSAPVRLRYVEGSRQIIADREVSFKAERAATYVAVRFYFKNGTFYETDLIGVPHINLGETAHVKATA